MEPTSRQLCEELLGLVERFKVRLHHLSDTRSLTRAQAQILYLLERKGELSMGQLAGIVHCDASNITGMIDRLVAQKMVTRQESARDRRIKTLRLTEKGRVVSQEILATMPSVFGCDALSGEDQATLRDILRKLH